MTEAEQLRAEAARIMRDLRQVLNAEIGEAMSLLIRADKLGKEQRQ